MTDGTFPRVVAVNVPSVPCFSESLRSFDDQSDLLFAVTGFVVCDTAVDILQAFGQRPAEQAGQLRQTEV